MPPTVMVRRAPPPSSPETSTNLAFFEPAPLDGTSVPLAQCGELLDRIVGRGFAVEFAY